jgi:hypothetical protein
MPMDDAQRIDYERALTHLNAISASSAEARTHHETFREPLGPVL